MNSSKMYKQEQNINFCERNFQTVNDWYNEYFSTDFNQEEHQLNEEEYFKILHSQKNTSPGYDNVPWLILKKLHHEIHILYLENI